MTGSPASGCTCRTRSSPARTPARGSPVSRCAVCCPAEQWFDFLRGCVTAVPLPSNLPTFGPPEARCTDHAGAQQGTAHGYLPSGVAATLRDAFAATTGGRCELARPAEQITRPPISRAGPTGTWHALDDSDGESIDAVYAAFRAARRTRPRPKAHRAVISGNGDLVQDVSWYFGTTRPREHPLFLQPRVGAPEHVPGRLGVLASRGDGNYYHFLADVLARIGVLEQATGIDAPQRWYVPAQLRFQHELLDLIGIGADRRVDAARFPHVQADVLVVPAPPAMTEKIPRGWSSSCVSGCCPRWICAVRRGGST